MLSYLLPVFYAVLQLMLLMLVGLLARRSRLWGADFFRSLSGFVVKIALPLYFVVRVGRADLSAIGEVIVMPVLALVVIGLGLILSLGVFSLTRYAGSDRRAGIALSTFGNSGYIPLTLAAVLPTSVPAIATRYGDELPTVMIAAFVFGFSPLLWSVGRYVISRRHDDASRIDLRHLVSPPLVGTLIGLVIALSGLQPIVADPGLPFYHVFDALDRLGSLTLPLALVCMGALIGGLRVSRSAVSHYLGMAMVVSAVRYALIPAAFFALLRFGALAAFGPVALYVLFLETHTPPATNLALMANESGVNTEHTAVTLLVTYVLYLMLMPFYLGAFLWLTGPA